MPSATIWLNKVDANQFPLEIFQTWNPYQQPREGTLLGRATFQRPVLTTDAVKGIHLLEKLQGKGNLWYCGSYARFGMPLLENGVRSALEIAEALGVERPWHCPEPPSKTSMLARLLAITGVVTTSAVVLAMHFTARDNPWTHWAQRVCPYIVYEEMSHTVGH
eukprot:TRINITY_DN752_c2_g1_i4.p1 TRINITY_DN752_c2_g1~~TRINITY_DN752_c2_g1_i4.p1  ORF type:complete len:163 (-),score=24.42 TRINITY_DN752_c2_g1_i4:219-707(-)